MANELQTNKLDAISTSVTITMDEVVSVFVSRFEDAQFDEKARLSKEIKEVKSKMNQLDRAIEEGVDLVPYTIGSNVLGLGLETSVDKVNCRWESKSSSPNEDHVEINIRVKDVLSTSRFTSNYWSMIRNVPISEVDVTEHYSLKDQLNQLNSELVIVLNNIRSINRKERQVRAKISERKLQESGLEDLLNDEELLKLVNMS